LLDIVKFTGEKIVNENPFFDVLFNFVNFHVLDNLENDLSQNNDNESNSNEPIGHELTNTFLNFSVNTTGDELSITFSLQRKLKSGKSLNDLAGYFEKVLECYLENSEEIISPYKIIPDTEIDKLLFEFNNSNTDYPKYKNVIELFEKSVNDFPESIAVILGDKKLTYKELDERSNQLANYLQLNGVKSETLVPLLIERSIEMIVGIFGIIKAGGAYVPIDPEYPEERISFMLNDTDASVIVSSKLCKAVIPEAERFKIISPDEDWSEINRHSNEKSSDDIKTEQLAYVIYTSGSTGKPKGVMIEHKGVLNLAMSQKELLRLTPEMKTLQFASIGFDASCYEIFNTLLSGGSLVLCNKEDLLTAEGFENLVNRNKIDLAVLPTTFQNIIKESTGTISTIVSAGEALNIETAQYFQSKGIRLINAYGPTETTVCASLTDDPVRENNVVTIGRPNPNQQIYIIDNSKDLCPLGVAGEICVAGAQVARGYLKRADLTNEKFISNPFSKDHDSKLYRTGDSGRWLPDGNIEYLGRIDTQIKLRGYRIELGEIENVLMQSELVSQAVVAITGNNEGNKKLVGYVVPENIFNKEDIQSYLSSRLPAYMIPAIWIELESLPLTNSGKIDRKSLPDPDETEISGNEYISPRNETEESLVKIWKELLGRDRIGINDNFFELGGDSIITIQVVSRAKRLGYELKPKDLFNYQTVSSLSEIISERVKAAVTGEQGVLSGDSGLLPIQQWYFENSKTEVSHFNQSVILNIDKNISVEILNHAIEILTSHHDALRFQYHKKDGQWIQEYGENKIELITLDLQSSNKESLPELIKENADKYQRSLDIEKGDIKRFVFIKTPDGETHNRLLLIIHHLATDGVSWRILLNDIELLLTELQNESIADLGFKSSSYRQWFSALENYSQSKRLLSQRNYWTETESNNEPIKTDKKYTGIIRVKDIETKSMNLDQAKTQLLLQEVPAVYHTEINDLLLCALALTICEKERTEKIVIGLEGHGREDIAEGIDTSRTVGWFTSLYPVLLELKKDINISDAIKSVKEQLRRIPDKGLGYGVLKYIKRDEKLSGKDDRDLVFNYLGQLDNVVSGGKWLSSAEESTGSNAGDELEIKNKLSLNARIQSGELIINWSYSKLHFEEETISKLIENYQTILEKLITHCIEQKKTGMIFTPSDYGLGNEISFEELDRFLNESLKDGLRKDLIDGIYRLSGLQKGMLFHGMYDGKAGAYIEQLSCDIENPDMEIIQQSWSYVLSRHSILRSGFYYDEFSIPVQCVYKNAEIPVTILDYRNFNKERQLAEVKKYVEADRLKGFDFKSYPLMRIVLVRLSEDNYKMLWTWHHILFDGWSMPILMEEFLTTYEMIASGNKLDEKEEDRFEDYIRYLEREDAEKQETYWREYLQGIEESTLLPFIDATTQLTKGQGIYKSMFLNFNKETTAMAENFAQSNRITLNTLMQGIWSYLLHSYTGSKDIISGTIVSGRPDDLPSVEQRVGMFINTLPLRTEMNKEKKINEWLQEIQKDQIVSRQYQFTPLQEIQSWTGIQGDLFDNILVFENYPLSEIVGSKEWKLKAGNMKILEQTNYPLNIFINNSEKLEINFSYNTELLKDEYVNEIRDHFENVFRQIISNNDLRLEDIKLLTKAQKEKLLFEFNDTEKEYPDSKCISELFEEQAIQNPDAVAIVFENEQLTYKELDERSNQIAHFLRSKGVKEETLVAICIERSIMMVTGILGILKTGAAFVPIDPEFPADRMSYMLKDSGAKIVLSSKESKSKLQADENIEIIELDNDWINISKQSKDKVDIKVNSGNLAYVIYTSGSTGLPKGVMIENRSVVNLLKSIESDVNFTNESSFLSVTTYSFDICYLELFVPLVSGGKLIVVSRDTAMDGFKLKESLEVHKPTHMQATPATWLILLDANWRNKEGIKILIGGEAVKESIKNELTKLGDVYNLYGPTETTIWSSIKKLELNEKVMIGKPIANTEIYIVNESGQLCPVRVAGEICIAGEGLARGYFNRADLTEEKFVPNPFSKNPGEKMYRTGDMGLCICRTGILNVWEEWTIR
jgi:amino acid adenylation domain-containing protein/non-ribosomal peptide synthase protein (TIGR01720 family)